MATVTGCAAVGDDNENQASHLPPEASLRVPIIAEAGHAVTLDASASTDSSGTLTLYVFDFNDGSESLRTNEPVTRHTFAHEGVYSVQVQVQNAAGDTATAVQDIAIRNDDWQEASACDTASDCVIGDDCHHGVCYSTGGAVY